VETAGHQALLRKAKANLQGGKEDLLEGQKEKEVILAIEENQQVKGPRENLMAINHIQGAALTVKKVLEAGEENSKKTDRHLIKKEEVKVRVADVLHIVKMEIPIVPVSGKATVINLVSREKAEDQPVKEAADIKNLTALHVPAVIQIARVSGKATVINHDSREKGEVQPVKEAVVIKNLTALHVQAVIPIARVSGKVTVINHHIKEKKEDQPVKEAVDIKNLTALRVPAVIPIARVSGKVTVINHPIREKVANHMEKEAALIKNLTAVLPARAIKEMHRQAMHRNGTARRIMNFMATGKEGLQKNHSVKTTVRAPVSLLLVTAPSASTNTFQMQASVHEEKLMT